MKFPFLASLIVFILVLTIAIKRTSRRGKNEESSFWAREREANSTRRKSIEHLPYIQIPLERFPTSVLAEDARVLECIDILTELSSQRILNLTGYTNTDLKLEYGTANITVLTEYDQNYTLLVRTLQQWADCLIDAGYDKEASVLLEFAVSTNTDISRTYDQLADYYISIGSFGEIDRLIATAEKLHSSSKSVILRHLKEKKL